MAAGAALDHVVVVDEGGWDELVAAAPVALGPAAGRARPDDGEVLFRGANAFAGSVGHCLVALLVVDVEAAAAWAARHGRAARTPAELAEDETVLEEFARGVAGVNERSGRAEQVRRHVVLGEVWQPDSAVLTPTLKLKRRCVAAVYHDRIEASTTTYRPVGRLTPVDDAAMLTELEPVVAGLVERHLGRAKEWFPHELVPWGRGRDFAKDEAWDPAEYPVPDAVRSALFLNLLTEDNLPYYFAHIARVFGDSAWGEWARRWTAEEGRHAIVIRDYLTVTRALDPVALERGRMAQVSGGVAPEPETVPDTLVYVALQELATRISHMNTAKHLTEADRAGYEVMARVAADENLHYLFYRDATSAALELDPSAVVVALDRQVRSFAMPGVGVPDFETHASRIARLGIYDFVQFHDHILQPVVMRHWRLELLEGISAAAEEARERLVKHISRVGAAARRVAQRRADLAGLAPA